ncbi:MAG TPA: 2-C-methyl-D-erythritol 4-phosphate cytidylyltransferase, partial [Candidatus Sulfotelmatobacter sp.]|nr:2-C-methyl-D-erythritol 4-phosphate cytidylyltransferase [Candidatus Sulfotelmatobacter sp.]
MKIVVIIPAAGLGTRMLSSQSGKAGKPAASKQFVDLQGTPVLIHTLRKFAANPEVT